MGQPGRSKKYRSSSTIAEIQIPEPWHLPLWNLEFLLWNRRAENHPILLHVDLHRRLLAGLDVENVQGERVARGLEGFVEQIGSEDHLVVEADDRVSGLDSRFFRRAARYNLNDLDHRKQIRRSRLGNDADRTSRGRPGARDGSWSGQRRTPWRRIGSLGYCPRRIEVNLNRDLAAGTWVKHLQSQNRPTLLHGSVELCELRHGRAVGLEDHVAFLDACFGCRATFLNFGDSCGPGAKPDPDLFGFHSQSSRRRGSRRWLGLALGGLLRDQSAHVHLDGGLLAAADIVDGQRRDGAALEDGRRKLIEIRDETAIDADDGIARLDSRLSGRALGRDINDLQDQPAADLDLLGPDPQPLHDRPGPRRRRSRGWCCGCLAGSSLGGRLGFIGHTVLGNDAGLVEPVGERSFPAALRPGVEVRANLAFLGGYGAVAAGTWSPLVFRRRLEDMDVNLVAGCRCLHSLGVDWRPAIFRPRDFNLDHVINLCLSGAAEDLAHDPIDDDGRPFLGLGGPLGGRGRAKHAHDAQRDRGSDYRSLGVTHVCSLNLDEEKARLTRPPFPQGKPPIFEASPVAWPRRTYPENECSVGNRLPSCLRLARGRPRADFGHDQNSIRRNALMPMRSGIKVPRMPTIRLAMIAIDSQSRKPLCDRAMPADSGCSWPAK